MRLLISDSGIKSATIRDALVGLLGKPIAECTAGEKGALCDSLRR